MISYLIGVIIGYLIGFIIPLPVAGEKLTINEKFELCLGNGLSAKSALLGALPIELMVDVRILNDLVLEHFPAYKIRFFMN
jgi:hypothetical protein